MNPARIMALAAILAVGILPDHATAGDLHTPIHLPASPVPQALSPQPTTRSVIEWQDGKGWKPDADQEGITDADAAVYAMGGKEHLDGWHFIYGPVHSSGDKSAVYSAKGRNGTVVISCGSTGKIEMIFGIAGSFTDTGYDATPIFTVGEKSHPLTVRAAKNPPHQVETVYYATGMDVLGILKIMAGLDIKDQEPDVISIALSGRRLSLPSPWPSGNAKEMLALCVRWNNDHIASTH